MSNTNAVENDKIKDVKNNEQDVDQNSNKEVESEVDVALEEHKKEVYEGMIQSNLAKIAKGELKLEDLKGDKMKAEVESRLKKNTSFLFPEQNKVDENKIIDEVEKRQELKSLLNAVSEEERETARQDYDVMLKGGKNHEQVIKSLRKLYDVKTSEEKRAYAERAHKVGVVNETLDTIDERKLNATEKAMIDYVKNLK